MKRHVIGGFVVAALATVTAVPSAHAVTTATWTYQDASLQSISAAGPNNTFYEQSAYDAASHQFSADNPAYKLTLTPWVMSARLAGSGALPTVTAGKLRPAQDETEAGVGMAGFGDSPYNQGLYDTEFRNWGDTKIFNYYTSIYPDPNDPNNDPSLAPWGKQILEISNITGPGTLKSLTFVIDSLDTGQFEANNEGFMIWGSNAADPTNPAGTQLTLLTNQNAPGDPDPNINKNLPQVVSYTIDETTLSQYSQFWFSSNNNGVSSAVFGNGTYITACQSPTDVGCGGGDTEPTPEPITAGMTGLAIAALAARVLGRRSR
ncbi:MAG: hypothetical protein K8S99_13760 [Planctomycetes bacterium]|nr:hypothetical protein [Planctomycetota bacterium]